MITVGPLPSSVGSTLNPAKFYYRQVHNSAKSTESGKPVYNDVLFIKIIHDPLNINDVPATEYHKLIYSAEYLKFEQQTKKASDGTSIDVLFDPASQRAIHLRAQGIFTVEQLAEGDFGDDTLRARRYFASLENSGQFRHYQTLLEQKEAEITALKTHIQALKNRIEALENDKDLVGRTRGF